MRARVKYKQPIEIEREDGTLVNLPMEGQTVEVIRVVGENPYECGTVGFPWVGTFSIGKCNVEIIEDI